MNILQLIAVNPGILKDLSQKEKKITKPRLGVSNFMEGTGYDQKEKSMCNYICFWKRQSDFTRCLAKLHAAGVTRGLIVTT